MSAQAFAAAFPFLDGSNCSMPQCPLHPCSHLCCRPPLVMRLSTAQVCNHEAAVRCYQRAIEGGDPDGVAVHSLVRV
jgi:hypothetical protein